MKSLFVALALFPVLFSATVQADAASDSTAPDIFTRMDGDHDGAVIREEFQKALPQVRQGAFDSIDSSHDGRISREEWNAFRRSHGRSGMSPMNQMPSRMQEKMPSGDHLPPVLPEQEMIKPNILPPVSK